MYAKHSIPFSDHNWDLNIIINYFLLVMSSKKQDFYKRGYNKDLSDMEESGDCLSLCQSIPLENHPLDDKNFFRYERDANGRVVNSDFKALPFYCVGKDGKLKRVYENFGNMYDVIDLIIQGRVQLEMNEVKTSFDEACKQYQKRKSGE